MKSLNLLALGLCVGLMSTQVQAGSGTSAARGAGNKAQNISVKQQSPAAKQPQAKATTTEYAILIGLLGAIFPSQSGTRDIF